MSSSDDPGPCIKEELDIPCIAEEPDPGCVKNEPLKLQDFPEEEENDVMNFPVVKSDSNEVDVAVDPYLLPVNEEDDSILQPLAVCDVKQETRTPYGGFTDSDVAEVAVDPYLLPVKEENDSRPQPIVVTCDIKQETGTSCGGFPAAVIATTEASPLVAVDPLLLPVKGEDDSILQPIAICNIKQELGHGIKEIGL